MFHRFSLYLLLIICLSSCSHPIRNQRLVKKTTQTLEQVIPKKRVVPPANPLLKTTVAPLIMIDPGHGGEDFGTYSLKKGKYKEKFLNLTTARIVRNYLHQMGYQTLMTRSDDVFVSLEKRAVFANNKQPKLFVSIHYNSAPNKEADGIEVFYYRSDEDHVRTKASKKLAQAILNQVVINTEAKSRGIKHGNLAVIRETQMPAVLIEGGFLTNDDELKKLKDTSYLKRLSWGIAKGIQDYIVSEIP